LVVFVDEHKARTKNYIFLQPKTRLVVLCVVKRCISDHFIIKKKEKLYQKKYPYLWFGHTIVEDISFNLFKEAIVNHLNSFTKNNYEN